MSDISNGEREQQYDREHQLEITIRTPAGIPHECEVRSDELDATVIKTSVHYFTAHGQLAAGEYTLALVRGGQATVMTDSGRLSDYEVVDDDTLSLIAKAPEVDGACCTPLC